VHIRICLEAESDYEGSLGIYVVIKIIRHCRRPLCASPCQQCVSTCRCVQAAQDMTSNFGLLLVAALKGAAGLGKPHIRPPHHVLYAALELGRSLRVLGVLQRHLGDGMDATAQLRRALQVTQPCVSSAWYNVATRPVLLRPWLHAACCVNGTGWSAHRAPSKSSH